MENLTNSIKNFGRKTISTKNFGQLTIGTVINYYCGVTAQDTDYVVLEQLEDRWGKFTKVLNKENNEIDRFTQHTEIKLSWSIVKTN
tara:strand:+ start:185 stop:445 length:261 start_codon:yes stop_codon:yes gene_type:complete